MYGVGDAEEETTVGKEAGFRWGEALDVAASLEVEQLFLEPEGLDCAPVARLHTCINRDTSIVSVNKIILIPK